MTIDHTPEKAAKRVKGVESFMMTAFSWLE